MASAVGTRTAEECCQKHMQSGRTLSKGSKVKATAAPVTPSITAKQGTLARRQQIRDVVEHLNKVRWLLFVFSLLICLSSSVGAGTSF